MSKRVQNLRIIHVGEILQSAGVIIDCIRDYNMLSASIRDFLAITCVDSVPKSS